MKLPLRDRLQHYWNIGWGALKRRRRVYQADRFLARSGELQHASAGGGLGGSGLFKAFSQATDLPAVTGVTAHLPLASTAQSSVPTRGTPAPIIQATNVQGFINTPPIQATNVQGFINTPPAPTYIPTYAGKSLPT